MPVATTKCSINLSASSTVEKFCQLQLLNATQLVSVYVLREIRKTVLICTLMWL